MEWKLLVSEPGPSAVEAAWFQELCAHAVNAAAAQAAAQAAALPADVARYAYAADPHLLVRPPPSSIPLRLPFNTPSPRCHQAWDLCCCVLAHLHRPAYLAVCADSHLNFHNAPAVAAAFFEAAQGQARASNNKL
jgi:hypothetical protein